MENLKKKFEKKIKILERKEMTKFYGGFSSMETENTKGTTKSTLLGFDSNADSASYGDWYADDCP